MIQRIQTVFFALVVIFQILFALSNIAYFIQSDETIYYTLYKVVNANGEVLKTQLLGGILNGISILLTVVIIFMYKKRSVQVKLGQLNLLLLASVIAVVFFDLDDYAKSFGENTEPNYSFFMILPLLSLIANYLGIHFVKKDEALVRAADRLR
jgi:glucan phosphoethanolaminetransferase (alkaline phosphatase superfamily)